MPRRLDALDLSRASLAWYSFQLIGGRPVSTSRIVMQPSTGQTRLHMLQPTHVSSLIVNTLTVPSPAPGTTSHPPEWITPLPLREPFAAR